MSSLESDVRIELIKDANSPFIQEIIDLADANKKTLGFCPYCFYQQHAKNPGILVAFINDDLAGYLIWSVNKNKNYTRLWQLCVKQEHKGKKLAKRLNDELVKLARPLSSQIQFHCKSYYGIDEMWRALGYSSIFDKPAKRPGDTLTDWSMRFINPNLPSIFSYIDSENLALKCSIDAYTLQKFIKENPSENSVEWLRSYLGVCVTSEILNEIKTLYPERQEDLWSLVKSHFLQEDCENIGVTHCQK